MKKRRTLSRTGQAGKVSCTVLNIRSQCTALWKENEMTHVPLTAVATDRMNCLPDTLPFLEEGPRIAYEDTNSAID